MKRIFAYFATFFLMTTCVSLPSLKENEQRYNAKMSDVSVQNLFDTLVDNQEDTVLNNYSTVYFSNLTSNFPINSHGTCAYVAISTILSFYDSYWDDDFVAEDLEQTVSYSSTVSTNQYLDLPPIDTESPGVISEDIEDVENLTTAQYQNFILANQNNYLQSYLIKLAYDMFDGYRFDSGSNPYGMTLYEQTHLAMYYLIYRRSITSNRAIVSSSDNYNQNDLCDYIVSRLIDGIPILDPEFCNRKSSELINEEKQGIFEQNYNSMVYYFQVDGFYLGE